MNKLTLSPPGLVIAPIPDVEPQDKNTKIQSLLDQADDPLRIVLENLQSPSLAVLRWASAQEADRLESEVLGASEDEDLWDAANVEQGHELSDFGGRHMRTSSDEEDTALIGPRLPRFGRPGSSPESPPSPDRTEATSNEQRFAVCGLRNLGNTCYMNAGLQCLASIRPLAALLLSPGFDALVRPDNALGWGGTVARSVAAIIRDILTKSYMSPSQFKRSLGSANPMFEGFGQHDVQEFLTFALDGLHEDINQGAPAPPLQDAGNLAAVWNHHRARNLSPVVDIFHGIFQNTVVCDTCHHR